MDEVNDKNDYKAWILALAKKAEKFLKGEFYENSGNGCSIKVAKTIPSDAIMKNARILVDWMDDVYPFLTDNTISVTKIHNETKATIVKCTYISDKFKLKK